MHVLYIVQQYPELSERFLAREVEALSAAGLKVTLFSLRPPRRKGIWLPYERGTLYATGRGALRGFVSAPLTAIGLGVQALAASAVHLSREPILGLIGALALLASRSHARGLWDRVHGAFAGLPAATAMYYSRMTGIRWSFAAHARDVLVRPVLMGRKIALADRVVACTEFAAGRLAEHAAESDRGKIRTVRHGLPRELYDQLSAGSAVREKSDDFRLLAIGRLVPKKGFIYLLEALKELQRRGVRAMLTIVGEGPERNRLSRSAEKNGLGRFVVFTGERLPRTIPGFCHGADVFVAPSIVASDGDQDGLPNVVLEAAASRLAIVATSVGGICEFVRHGETGLIVPPGDPQALADALERVLSNPDLRARLGGNACQEVEKEFLSERNARKLGAALGWLHE